MIGETNVNGGAGFNNQKALLKIKASTGSTIVVSKDSYSKQIKDYIVLDNKRSYWYFETSDYGTWTITATLGSDTTSMTVLVTTNVEYDVVLNYYLYAWEYGGSYDETYWGTMNVTHPAYTTIGDTIVGVSPSSGYQWAVIWPNAFSASRKLSKIYLDAKIDSVLVSSGGYELKFGVSTKNDGLAPSQTYCVAYKMVNTVANRQIYELDVSSVESGYLFVGGVGSMTIYNMYGK